MTNSIAAQLVAIARMPTPDLRTLWNELTSASTRRSSAGGT